MKTPSCFSKTSNDLRLIFITHSNIIDPKTVKEMEDIGWKKTKIKKNFSAATRWSIPRPPPISIVNSDKYVNAGNVQGDKFWYSDLARIATPNHKPGILTRLIG